jgi:membrane protein
VSTMRQPMSNHALETSDVAVESGRGRKAEKPTEIPARGWLDVTWRAAKRFSDDNVTLIAGGLAMYALLSVFPALAATVSIYGMFATPSDVIGQMTAFAGVLPPGVWDIFNTELQSIVREKHGDSSERPCCHWHSLQAPFWDFC